MDESPLDSIIKKAIILSAKQYSERPIPKAKRGRKAKGHIETFVCRRACELKNTTYTEDFDWDEIKPETENDVDQLVERINDEIETIRAQKRNSGTSKLVKRPLKRKQEESDDDDDVDEYADEVLEDIDEDGPLDGNESDEINRTPRKKKKHTKTMTPRKPRTPSKLLTPSHKR